MYIFVALLRQLDLPEGARITICSLIAHILDRVLSHSTTPIPEAPPERAPLEAPGSWTGRQGTCTAQCDRMANPEADG